MFKFDLQRFGGGGKGTSINYAPAQEKAMSEQEKGLLQQQFDFNDKIKAPMFNLVDMADTALQGTSFNPSVDYKQMYDTANSAQAKALTSYNQNVANFQNLAGEYGQNQNANNALSQESANMNAGYQNEMQNVYNNFGSLDPEYQKLANGQLPSAFTDNKKAVIGDAIRGSLGEALNTGARRNIINSSISNDAVNKIGNWGAKSMNESFNNDINTVSGLLGQRASVYGQQANNINSAAAIGNTDISNRAGLLNDNTNLIGNKQNLYGQAGQMNMQQVQNALVPMQTANQAQDASLSYPGKLMQMAIGAYQPGSDLFKTTEASRLAMSTPGQYYATQQSSPWGAVGSIGGSLIACFPAGTEVLCPAFSRKLVEDIREGDIILTIRNNELVEDIVKFVKQDRQEIFVISHNSRITGEHVLRCTGTQGIFTTEGIVEANQLRVGQRLITVYGSTKVTSIENAPSETVFDIGTENFHSIIADFVLVEVW